MADKVEGYITKDGRFFRTREEADYMEAMHGLYKKMEDLGISGDALEWVNQLSDEIQDYLETRDEFNRASKQSRPVFNSKKST